MNALTGTVWFGWTIGSQTSAVGIIAMSSSPGLLSTSISEWESLGLQGDVVAPRLGEHHLPSNSTEEVSRQEAKWNRQGCLLGCSNLWRREEKSWAKVVMIRCWSELCGPWCNPKPPYVAYAAWGAIHWGWLPVFPEIAGLEQLASNLLTSCPIPEALCQSSLSWMQLLQLGFSIYCQKNKKQN